MASRRVQHVVTCFTLGYIPSPSSEAFCLPKPSQFWRFGKGLVWHCKMHEVHARSTRASHAPFIMIANILLKIKNDFYAEKRGARLQI
jgi:hypothetical protein